MTCELRLGVKTDHLSADGFDLWCVCVFDKTGPRPCGDNYFLAANEAARRLHAANLAAATARLTMLKCDRLDVRFRDDTDAELVDAVDERVQQPTIFNLHITRKQQRAAQPFRFPRRSLSNARLEFSRLARRQLLYSQS